MKLTGKCKEEFLKSHGKDKYFDFVVPDTYENALIIEFFDSVGFYINTEFNSNFNKYKYSISNCGVYFRNNWLFNSRTEANNEAIIKANDLYNENN